MPQADWSLEYFGSACNGCKFIETNFKNKFHCTKLHGDFNKESLKKNKHCMFKEKKGE